MINKRNSLDKVSVEELEQILRVKRRQERQERFIRLSAQGASTNAALLANERPNYQTTAAPPPANKSHHATNDLYMEGPPPSTARQIAATPVLTSKKKKVRETVLLTVEIGALVGLVIVLVSSYMNLRTLNNEVVEAQNTSRFNQVVSAGLFMETEANASSETLQSTFAVDLLPGGHTPPTAPGGAIPDVPTHLQNWVQPPPPVPIPPPTQKSAQATRIVIPKINVDAPIIQGVAWEDLKKGVGHLPGSAQPGERGNLYLAAHNDIFGEIFRYLEKLEPGDEYEIYAGEAKYTYIVREKRIIEPTEVGVMLPTTEPVATLQTCYPYLIDTHRLVVISDLIN